MQPNYGVLGNHHYRHRHSIMEDGGSCPSSDYPILSSQNLSLHHPYQQRETHQNFSPETPQQRSSVAATHQLFHHQQQFPPFQQFEERLDREISQQVSSFPSFFGVNFKLGLNENSGNTHQDGALNQGEAATLLNGDDSILSNSLVMPHCWNSNVDSAAAIKEPFWKLLNRSNSEKEVQGSDNKHYNLRRAKHVDGSRENCKNSDCKFGLFGELEAICSIAKTVETNQTGSGFAPTGENSPTNKRLFVPFGTTENENIGAVNNVVEVDHGSENSIGEEVLLRKRLKRKRKRKLKQKLNSMVGFFQNLVKELVNHQEKLHREFLEAIERMDRERTQKEETWRRQEAEEFNREVIARAREQAQASDREIQFLSYVGKITGQSIDLPARRTPLVLQAEAAIDELTTNESANHKRWPKAEVEALIQIRSSIETKFQETGLKGPLWEEVSHLMGSMGYERSAKRCKEKWENINKYFRKAKESTKKRSQQSKTCSYFSQLDELYSRTHISRSADKIMSGVGPLSMNEAGIQNKDIPELLEAFTVQKSLTTATKSNVESDEMGSERLQFDDSVDCRVEFEEVSRQQGEDHSDEQNKNCREAIT
ncbi:hypothetical protein K2173_017550 [Erythroxylum novogranatense]|uniref:Myb-like domain-containing protein n=1 Tax=Erythroxylum novogranatense TaxID=1862640 RepID=A0AAV8TM70_9ROSI|nr:hypothetical protein K2173_017550 [Erythroxylum novogranatense]